MELTITKLIEILEKYKDEVGCDGTKIGSHNTKSTVEFRITNPELDIDVELTDIELDLRMGCMCPQGIIFNLKAVVPVAVEVIEPHGCPYREQVDDDYTLCCCTPEDTAMCADEI